jgi:hypothetical protein
LANRIPADFNEHVLGGSAGTLYKVEEDFNCLAQLKHYHSLIPMAMEVRKPIFLLRPADGAIGAHYQAVLRAYGDFLLLTEKIIQSMDSHDQLDFS